MRKNSKTNKTSKIVIGIIHKMKKFFKYLLFLSNWNMCMKLNKYGWFLDLCQNVLGLQKIDFKHIFCDISATKLALLHYILLHTIMCRTKFITVICCKHSFVTKPQNHPLRTYKLSLFTQNINIWAYINIYIPMYICTYIHNMNTIYCNMPAGAAAVTWKCCTLQENSNELIAKKNENFWLHTIVVFNDLWAQ